MAVKPLAGSLWFHLSFEYFMTSFNGYKSIGQSKLPSICVEYAAPIWNGVQKYLEPCIQRFQARCLDAIALSKDTPKDKGLGSKETIMLHCVAEVIWPPYRDSRADVSSVSPSTEKFRRPKRLDVVICP